MLFSSDNKDVWDYVQQVNGFQENHSFVELFSSKAREDLVFKNRKGEGKYVAVYVKHVVYYLRGGGGGVVEAL